jgi:hypothetical protein
VTDSDARDAFRELLLSEARSECLRLLQLVDELKSKPRAQVLVHPHSVQAQSQGPPPSKNAGELVVGSLSLNVRRGVPWAKAPRPT